MKYCDFTKSTFQEQSSEYQKNIPEEEEKKRGYARNRYKTMSDERKTQKKIIIEKFL